MGLTVRDKDKFQTYIRTIGHNTPTKVEKVTLKNSKKSVPKTWGAKKSPNK